MTQKSSLKIALACVFAVPALAVRWGELPVTPAIAVALFGAAVVCSAFLLTWAAEAAQVDISASLAVALLALIAVLPEYAVDLYFAYVSGHRPEFAPYAAANMTGSNRLLIGFGWPLVVLVYWLFSRRRSGARSSFVELDPRRRVELAFLGLAGVFCFSVPIAGRVSLWHSAILILLFGAYMWRVSSHEKSEPDLVGVAEDLGRLSKARRRATVASLFVLALVFIGTSAAPFGQALVESGKRLHIDEFLLVQWLAPLASEAPELLVAAVFASRLKGNDAIGTLLSSKVNQWTLLVGSLPLAHLAGGGGTALPLDARQTEEFFLTAAQTLLGFATLCSLRFGLRPAMLLLLLFLVQFPFSHPHTRMIFAGAYLAVGVVLLFGKRAHLPPIARALWPRRSDGAGTLDRGA